MYLPLRNSRIQLPQGKIFWREAGQGLPLLFLHGASRDGSQWLPVIEELTRDYHCFAPDLLGFGESEKPKVHYSIEWQVECLAAYLEALNLRQVYLIGHSLGGWIAASYALKYLDQVRGLVLIAPEGVEVKGKGGQKHWRKWLARPLSVRVFLLRSLLPLAKLFGFKAKIEQLLEYRKQLLKSPATCQLLFQRRRREIEAELLQNRLQWLKVPTLILQGEKDTPENIACSQAYAKAAMAKLHLISQGRNDLPDTFADKVAEEIKAFVN